MASLMPLVRGWPAASTSDPWLSGRHRLL